MSPKFTQVAVSVVKPNDGRPQNFFRGVQSNGSGDECPPVGSRDGAPVGVAPRSRQHVVKIIHK